MKKEVWFDARHINIENNEVLSLVANSNIDVMVIKASHRENYKFPQKTKYVVEIEEEEHQKALKKEDVMMSSNIEVLKSLKTKGFKTCAYLSVDDGKSLEEACRVSSNHEYVVIKFKSKTNIPLELLIARLQETHTVLLKEVDNAQDAEIAFGVMEKGSDGILLCTSEIKEIVEVNKLMEKSFMTKMKMITAIVKEVQHIGMGYRACIDTTSILTQDEGMIIGSTSQGGLLVSSETHYLPYMNLRPFRVNAGAVHSYVWCPGDTTEYLTDIKAGSKVLVMNHNGEAREVSVGRVKIEARPLLKIVAIAEGIEINTMIQDDWHIRILDIKGKPVNGSEIKEGTQLAAYICESGRHVGIKIDETIIER